MNSLLSVDNLCVTYGAVVALDDVSLNLQAGTAMAITGMLGAGKTTLLRAIAGLTKAESGTISFQDTAIDAASADARARMGITLVNASASVFGMLSVGENLRLSGEPLPEIEDSFPILSERMDQRAATLSGGEQRQLALICALRMRPKLLLLDEPLMGLAPQVAQAIIAVLNQRLETGMGIVVVEERSTAALLSLARTMLELRNGHLQPKRKTGAEQGYRLPVSPPVETTEVETVRIPLRVSEKRQLQSLATAEHQPVGEMLAELARRHIAENYPENSK